QRHHDSGPERRHADTLGRRFRRSCARIYRRKNAGSEPGGSAAAGLAVALGQALPDDGAAFLEVAVGQRLEVGVDAEAGLHARQVEDLGAGIDADVGGDPGAVGGGEVGGDVGDLGEEVEVGGQVGD